MILPTSADLAPGDTKSTRLNLAAFEVHRIRSYEDSHFDAAYQPLWAEFGVKNEMERRETLAARFALAPEMLYEMVLVQESGQFAAVRDHTAIAVEGEVIVHLSHNLVAPPFRRSGLAGWMRAFPVVTAREFLPGGRITLVSEMEYVDGTDPSRPIRLAAYEKAGFAKVDPSQVRYHQPDFRAPMVIDSTGGPQPVPFQLVIRRVGREHESQIGGSELRRIVHALYRMYGAQFRPQDMAHNLLALRRYPDDDEVLRLVPPDGANRYPDWHRLMQPRLVAYYHEGFAAPLGEHIMPIGKFALVAEEAAALPWVELREPSPVTSDDLRRVHTAEYIDAVCTGIPRALAESQRFPWSPELYPSVCLTSGGCLAAARQALRDGTSAALVSGFHHACSDHGEGFCTFNGLIVTADALLAAGEASRIAILDMDLHYGNGTAQLAASRPHVFAVSLYGNDYWNDVPYRDVTVRRHEDGVNHRSFALPAGCDRATLLRIIDDALPLLAQFRPDVLLYQAGADPYFEDPYSPLALDHDDLRARDRRVFEFAREKNVPSAWVLAGGYTSDINKVVRVHVNTFRAWAEAQERDN